ncbi:MAG TPA: response regulator [Burkholderiales bacterium]
MAAVWRPCCKRVLIIEDEEILAENIAYYLETGGAEVLVAHTGEQALLHLGHFAPQCVIADFNLPGVNGIETMRRIREQFPQTFCILITGQGSESVYVAARASGVDHILIKPFALPDLGSCLCTHQRAEALGGAGSGSELLARA